MDRRQFLRNSAILASGAIAADQLGLWEKLLTRGRSMVGWSSAVESDLVQFSELYQYVNGEYVMTRFTEVGPISRANLRQIMQTVMQEGPLYLPPLKNPQLLEGPLPVHGDGEPTAKLLVVSR